MRLIVDGTITLEDGRALRHRPLQCAPVPGLTDDIPQAAPFSALTDGSRPCCLWRVMTSGWSKCSSYYKCAFVSVKQECGVC